MVTSTLMVINILARVFFDPRAIHSSIFVDLASKIKKFKKELTKTLLVSTPLGRLLPTSEGINKCKIKIKENTIENDLVILNLNDSDIILGIDWLSKYHACLDYFLKIVTFRPKENIECMFQGEWMVVSPSFILCVIVDKMIEK